MTPPLVLPPSSPWQQALTHLRPQIDTTSILHPASLYSSQNINILLHGGDPPPLSCLGVGYRCGLPHPVFHMTGFL